MFNLNLPKPSKLFSLNPEGLGTPYTESLASYAMRLAEAHCIDIQDLIDQFIYPLIGHLWEDEQAQPRVVKARRPFMPATLHPYFNVSKWLDMSNETKFTIAALSVLTKRNDIYLLTVLPLEGYVKQDSIFRGMRAWCCGCYEEQKNIGRPVHDLLIWSFRDVCMCLRHEQRLRSACYWCTARQPVLNFYSKPGYCTKCGSWLGDGYNYRSEATYQDQWNAEAVGHLLTNWNSFKPHASQRQPTLQRLLAGSYETKDIMGSLLRGM